MHVELERDLAVKYPSLFLNPKDKNEVIPIDAGNGWYDLIDQLSEKLSTYPVSYANLYVKLGALQVHIRTPKGNPTNVSRDDLASLIKDAVEESKYTCSTCGHLDVNTNIHCINCNS